MVDHPSITAVATAYPPFVLSGGVFAELAAAQRVRRGFDKSARIVRHIQPLLAISRRFSIHPGLAGHEEDEVAVDGTLYENIFHKYGYQPPLEARLTYWADHVPRLATEAAAQVLKRWGGDLGRITHLVTTTTTGWVEPGLAAHIIHALGLPYTCEKQELCFNGCFCGSTALRVARDLVRCEPGRVCLVVAAESSSTHFTFNSTEPSGVIADSLFGDGASAIIVEQTGGWQFEAAGVFNVPDSSSFMTLRSPRTPEEQAYRIYLDRTVPDILAAALSTGLARPMVDRFMASCSRADAGFAVHPGGRRILDVVREFFVGEGYAPERFARSYQALDQGGNIATVSIGAVLESSLEDSLLEKTLMLSFGPGMTLEWGILGRSP